MAALGRIQLFRLCRIPDKRQDTDIARSYDRVRSAYQWHHAGQRQVPRSANVDHGGIRKIIGADKAQIWCLLAD
jgi:hypothetical protein